MFLTQTLNMYAFITFLLVLFVDFGLSSGASLDDLQKSRETLKSAIIILEKLESEEPFSESCEQKPSSCAEIFLHGGTESGVYTIYPKPWYKKTFVSVYCDMDTDGGGWTVFQKRYDYEVTENFYRNWDDYKTGFGSVQKDFWLGNENLFILTNQDHTTMRVDLEDFEGRSRFAHYNKFQVGDERDSYRLSIANYSGDARDNLGGYDNHVFVTFDRNDMNDCSRQFKGGWWYGGCHAANLNGLYLRGNHSSYADGVEWSGFKGQHYSLKKAEMKVRPTNFLSCK